MAKTKIELFNEIAALDAVKANDELADFIAGEIYILQTRKANRKPTQNQKDNEIIKEMILDGLRNSENPMRVKDLKALPELQEYTSQKLTALLNQLRLADLVERNVEKKITTFTLKA